MLVQSRQIEFICELHFSWKKTASILGIIESTLRRRRHELDLSADQNHNWSELSSIKKNILSLLNVTPIKYFIYPGRRDTCMLSHPLE